MAVYKSYKAVEVGMDNGAFAETIDGVLRLEYMAPLPLVEPIQNNLDVSEGKYKEPGNGGRSRSSTARPWAIGATVTMCVGGLIVLAVFLYGKRASEQQDKHFELDDASVSPDSCAKPEQAQPVEA